MLYAILRSKLIPMIVLILLFKFVGDGQEREVFEQNYPFEATGRVSVENINGSIIVEAWDKNEISLKAEKIASTKEDLDEMKFEVDATKTRFSVEYQQRRGSYSGSYRNGRTMRIDFHLFVPRGAVLESIETVNGAVEVSNFTNKTCISAVNGRVKAINLSGSATLSTVNGQTEADFSDVAPNANISLSTVNGRVVLSLPSDTNATISANSLSGNIQNSFGLKLNKGRYVGRDVKGKLGNGSANIKLESVNGVLEINKKNDGRQPSEVVDLKSNVKDDEWNSGNDTNMTVDVMEGGKTILTVNGKTTVIDNQAEIAKADEEVQKALEKLSKDKANEAELARLHAKVARAAQPVMPPIAVFPEGMRAGFGSSYPNVVTDSFKVSGDQKLHITAQSTRVFVRGWNKSEIAYTYRSTRSQDESSNLSIDRDDKKTTIKIENDSQNPAMLEIYVPRKTSVKFDGDSDVRIENLDGNIEVRNENASVNVRDSAGKLDVETEAGLVRVIGFDGEVNAKTESGTVSLEGKFSSVTGFAEDGQFLLNLPDQDDFALKANADVFVDGVELTSEDPEKPVTFGNGKSPFNFNFSSGGSVKVTTPKAKK